MPFFSFYISSFKILLPAEAMEMLKNLKPDDIKAAITNMPQEMKEMMKGMGK